MASNTIQKHGFVFSTEANHSGKHNVLGLVFSELQKNIAREDVSVWSTLNLYNWRKKKRKKEKKRKGKKKEKERKGRKIITGSP